MCSQTVTIATRYFLFVVQGDYKWGGPSDETSKTEVPMSRQVRHDKDPSLHKNPKTGSAKQRPKIPVFHWLW